MAVYAAVVVLVAAVLLLALLVGPVRARRSAAPATAA